MRAGLPVLALLLAAPFLRADVVVLVNQDRVTGRVVGKITRRVRVQTPYGVLVIPADKVERIRRDDGTEEVLNVPPTPDPTPPPPPATVVLAVSGHSFWQAWSPKAAPEDPSLRLEVRLDGLAIASYADAALDPEDLPKAVVNSFVFSPDLVVSVAAGFAAAPPELVSGEVRLRVTVPAELAGRHGLGIAYQWNEAGAGVPLWRDLVVGGSAIVIEPGGTTRVSVQQDRGTMEYARRGMRNVETFRAALLVEPR